MKVRLSSSSFVETLGWRSTARVAAGGIAGLAAVGPWLFGLFGLLGLLASRPAEAHALLTAPSPRDSSDSHKDPTGPCGVTRSATQPARQLTPGAPFNVTWNETVNHPGCFVVDFSAAGDVGFQVLATLPHSANGPTPRPYAQMVTLPAASCAACTLRVRQIMLSAEPAPGAACPPATLATGSTYYTCANVVLGTGAVDAGTPDAGGTDVAGDRPADSGARGGSGGTSNSGGSNGSLGTGGAITTGGITGGTGGTTGSSGGTPGAGTPTGSGGADVAGTTGSGALGTEQTGACACSTATTNPSSTWTAMVLSAVFILLLLRRRGRRNQKQPNLSPNLSRRIR